MCSNLKQEILYRTVTQKQMDSSYINSSDTNSPVCACFLCLRELVKLFCTERSHIKELMPFLTGLITSLDVSDVRSLQTSINNPQPARTLSVRRSLSVDHTDSHHQATTNRLFRGRGRGESRSRYMQLALIAVKPTHFKIYTFSVL